MIRITIELQNPEAKALRIMCRRFRFGDAQHFLSDTPNVKPDHLCEAVTRLLNALTDHDSPNKH
jgi:hypothetical protein